MPFHVEQHEEPDLMLGRARHVNRNHGLRRNVHGQRAADRTPRELLLRLHTRDRLIAVLPVAIQHAREFAIIHFRDRHVAAVADRLECRGFQRIEDPPLADLLFDLRNLEHGRIVGHAQKDIFLRQRLRESEVKPDLVLSQ